ncbi:hypothetical protein BDN72DRAFT_861189 [Pluteus cervinus]|uniref:Uncharacterized protein n=1 Tax=Pluteus cervinus TaxID=181527 RepID=A0ACD3AG81_9AGAR|nr:hypothetical protein BDN72DRAFT_861189 [Pluteus cervinus]
MWKDSSKHRVLPARFVQSHIAYFHTPVRFGRTRDSQVFAYVVSVYGVNNGHLYLHDQIQRTTVLMSFPTQNNTGINTNAQYVHNGTQERNNASGNNGSVFIGGTYNGQSNNASNNQTTNAPGFAMGPTYGPLVLNVAFNFGGSYANFPGFPTAGPTPAQPTPAQPIPAQPTPAPPTVPVTPTQAGPAHAPDSNNNAAPNTDDDNQNARNV